MKRLTGLLCFFFFLAVLCRNAYSAGTEKIGLPIRLSAAVSAFRSKNGKRHRKSSMESRPSTSAFLRYGVEWRYVEDNPGS